MGDVMVRVRMIYARSLYSCYGRQVATLQQQKKKQNINMNSYREPLLRKHTIPQMNSIQNRQKENSNILIKQVVQFKSRRKKK